MSRIVESLLVRTLPDESSTETVTLKDDPAVPLVGWVVKTRCVADVAERSSRVSSISADTISADLLATTFPSPCRRLAGLPIPGAILKSHRRQSPPNITFSNFT